VRNEDAFELAASIRGDVAPPATVERLFQRFFRAAARQGQQGLGLGLDIASETARVWGHTPGRLRTRGDALHLPYAVGLKLRSYGMPEV
jgi:signal transduction histidine kinase